MTKVGVIVECGRDGMEVHLCGRIAELLADEKRIELEVDIVPMNDKRSLVEGCGAAARTLVDGGCRRVVILWDERPAWPEKNEKLCWRRERDKIATELRKAGLARDKVSLVCIEREIESWLLADEHMLSCVLSRPTHPVRVRAPRNPETIQNPKSAMMTLFARHGRRYVNAALGRQFARCLSDLRRLRKCKTFRRFAETLVGP